MADSLLDNYNPLYDIHLRQYFALPHMQKHLQKMGLLESSLNLNGDEVYARHHAMMDMMLKNREAQLTKMADLRKKLDAAEKVEICRRIRSGQSPESYRRGKPSRSLSRGRGAQKGGRQRRFSNSFEDKDFVQKIEKTNVEPGDYNVKDPYMRLSANAKRFNYLHKLDDTTLIAYKDNLRKQLQRLERFREISFGPHSVARQPTPAHTSWFFRRRSLPSLTASAPGHTLTEPLRSIMNMRGRKTSPHAGAKLNASHDSRTSCPPTTRKRRDSNPRLPPIGNKTKAAKSAASTNAAARLPPAYKKASPSRGRPAAKRMTTTTTTTTKTTKPELPTVAGAAVIGAGAAAAAGAAVFAASTLLDDANSQPTSPKEQSPSPFENNAASPDAEFGLEIERASPESPEATHELRNETPSPVQEPQSPTMLARDDQPSQPVSPEPTLENRKPTPVGSPTALSEASENDEHDVRNMETYDEHEEHGGHIIHVSQPSPVPSEHDSLDQAVEHDHDQVAENEHTSRPESEASQKSLVKEEHPPAHHEDLPSQHQEVLEEDEPMAASPATEKSVEHEEIMTKVIMNPHAAERQDSEESEPEYAEEDQEGKASATGVEGHTSPVENRHEPELSSPIQHSDVPDVTIEHYPEHEQQGPISPVAHHSPLENAHEHEDEHSEHPFQTSEDTEVTYFEPNKNETDHDEPDEHDAHEVLSSRGQSPEKAHDEHIPTYEPQIHGFDAHDELQKHESGPSSPIANEDHDSPSPTAQSPAGGNSFSTDHFDISDSKSNFEEEPVVLQIHAPQTTENAEQRSPLEDHHDDVLQLSMDETSAPDLENETSSVEWHENRTIEDDGSVETHQNDETSASADEHDIVKRETPELAERVLSSENIGSNHSEPEDSHDRESLQDVGSYELTYDRSSKSPEAKEQHDDHHENEDEDRFSVKDDEKHEHVASDSEHARPDSVHSEVPHQQQEYHVSQDHEDHANYEHNAHSPHSPHSTLGSAKSDINVDMSHGDSPSRGSPMQDQPSPIQGQGFHEHDMHSPAASEKDDDQRRTSILQNSPYGGDENGSTDSLIIHDVGQDAMVKSVYEPNNGDHEDKMSDGGHHDIMGGSPIVEERDWDEDGKHIHKVVTHSETADNNSSSQYTHTETTVTYTKPFETDTADKANNNDDDVDENEKHDDHINPSNGNLVREESVTTTRSFASAVPSGVIVDDNDEGNISSL